MLCPPNIVERYIPMNMMMMMVPSLGGERKQLVSIDRILNMLYPTNNNNDNNHKNEMNLGYEIQLGDELIVNNHNFVDSRRYDKSDQSESASVDPSTYGEITIRGTRQLLYVMGLLQRQQQQPSRPKPPKQDIHLYDLGSGIGKFIIQVVMELSLLWSTSSSSSSVVNAYGIELSA